MTQQLYSMEDRSGRRLALRPEMVTPERGGRRFRFATKNQTDPRKAEKALNPVSKKENMLQNPSLRKERDRTQSSPSDKCGSRV